MGVEPARRPFEVSFGAHPAGMRVHVQGANSFDNTLAYWQAIVAEVRRRTPAGLLLVDELQGEPLDAAQWLVLVSAMRGMGLEQVRIAHVRPAGLQMLEHCEIFAVELGFQAHVFVDERAAELWLRYGEQGD
jgi:hypothetical protein